MFHTAYFIQKSKYFNPSLIKFSSHEVSIMEAAKICSSYVPVSNISFLPNRKPSNCNMIHTQIPNSRNKLLISLCVSERNAKDVGFEVDNGSLYSKDPVENITDESISDNVVISAVDVEKTVKPKTYALIHDFCLGIPFGGIVFTGSIIGFLLSRNVATLTGSGLLGGSILTLGFFSLKVWRQGLSCLPFILGQAALSAALFWHHLALYSLTKKIFPYGFNVVLSAAMVCFYSYVIISGGSPPPKKKKLVS